MRFHFLMLLVVLFVTLGMHGMASASASPTTIVDAATGEAHCTVHRV